MPRHNRRDPPATGAPAFGGSERREDWRGETYAVRAVAGSAAVKAYRCPGCDHEVRPGVAHVVVWPADDPHADDRRHWHRGCWSARERRGPGVQRSRSAPRYGRSSR